MKNVYMLTEKYRPLKLKDIIGNEEAKSQAKKWLDEFLKGKQKKALFIYGNTGIGKTSLAYALANEFNIMPIYISAAEKRNETTIKNNYFYSGQTVFGFNRILIFDDLEGLSKEDRGAINAIIKIIKEGKNPVILIANDYWDQKLKYLRNVSIPLHMKNLNTTQILKALEQIAEKEKIKDVDLKAIADSANGDLRAALNSLEAKTYGYRDKTKTLYDLMVAIFKSKNIDWPKKVISQTQDDIDLIKAWIDENLEHEYKDKEELAKGFDYLSKADLYTGRITKRQYWGFLRYASAFIVFVSLAKNKDTYGFSKYNFPSYIKDLSSTMEKRNMLKSIAKKIAKKIHSNSNYVINNIKFFTTLIKSNKDGAKNYYMLDDEEIEFLESNYR
jgi:replication factor C large subunit